MGLGGFGFRVPSFGSETTHGVEVKPVLIWGLGFGV